MLWWLAVGEWKSSPLLSMNWPLRITETFIQRTRWINANSKTKWTVRNKHNVTVLWNRVFWQIKFCPCMLLSFTLCQSRTGFESRTSHDLKWDTIRTLWLWVQISTKEDSDKYRLLDTLFFTYVLSIYVLGEKGFLLNLSYFAQSENVWQHAVTNTGSEMWPSHYVLKETKRGIGYCTKS
jgi:hypothetical protein